jgi:endonuclease VIII
LPEGDTVHKLAAALRIRLCGRITRRLELKRLDASALVGRKVSDVSSHGKHLFLELDNGLVLRSHLGMYGAWHQYLPTEAWRKPVWQASIVLEVDQRVFVCFNAKEVEILPAQGYRLLDASRRLGPDLIQDHLAPDVLVGRARALLGPDAPLVDLLLDQRVAAGIGNVYKSEVLFLERQPPLAPLAATPSPAIIALFRTAAELLRRNLQGGPRVTRPPDDGRGRLWVYGRAALPCLRCGAEIQRGTMGANRRITYWCPACQELSGRWNIRRPP